MIYRAVRQWLVPVILATQEAEIRRITVLSQWRQILREPISKKILHNKGLVQWLAQCVGPEFKPQHHKKKKKFIGIEIKSYLNIQLDITTINKNTYFMLARADGSSDGLPTKREASSLNTNTTKKEKKNLYSLIYCLCVLIEYLLYCLCNSKL
jgi:hypothetical protein